MFPRKKATIVCSAILAAIAGYLVKAHPEVAVLGMLPVVFYCGLVLMESYQAGKWEGLLPRLLAPMAGFILGAFLAGASR